MFSYNPSNWYWAVDGNDFQVYCSTSGSYVATSDGAYQSWLSAGNIATAISSDDLIKIRIKILEAQITQRRMREAVLVMDSGWLDNINSQIATLRSQFI